ncbi:chemotaxis protein CheB, partial [bacterium]
ASTGGIETLLRILSGLPEDLPASIFIVQHISPHSKGYLAKIFDNACSLKVVEAVDNQPIEKGYVYVAPPDKHLLVKKDVIKVIRGPKENRTRPAIDPLFRSAAASYTTQVIGVILTGALNDGTAGLLAVKECGGITLVQSPSDAICPSMPQSALDNVDVDYCLNSSEIANKLVSIVYEESNKEKVVPENIKIEAGIAEAAISDPHIQDKIGTPSLFSCPECGGRLWEIRNQPNKFLRFRCHIGHAYTATSMLSETTEVVDNALSLALRTLEDRVNLLNQMAEDAVILGQDSIANIYRKQANTSSKHAQVINNLLKDKEFSCECGGAKAEIVISVCTI